MRGGNEEIGHVDDDSAERNQNGERQVHVRNTLATENSKRQVRVRNVLATENGRCWQLVEVGVTEDNQTGYGD
jgi:hypothetical protein